MLFVIAWRNIWRNKTRSAVIIVSVLLGLWAGIFIIAFFMGMTNEQIDTAIAQQFSHMQVHHPKFRELDEAVYTIENREKVVELVKKEPGIIASSERIVITAMAASAYSSSGISLLGVDPEKEAAVTGLSGRINQGKYLEENGHNQLLIGKKLLEKLKLDSNSKVILTFQAVSGDLTSSAFRITGVFTAASTFTEENMVYINRRELDSLAGFRGGIHELAILLQSNDQLESTAASLRQKIAGGARLETWKQLSPDLRLMIDSFEQYMYIIIGILLIALAFGIVNTMLMSVLERQKELGVLMAVGLNKSKLFSMILLETIGITFLGCLAGLPLAWLTVMITNHTGINLSRFSEGLAMYGFGNIIYPYLEASYYWKVAGMSILAAILAAVYPAYKALQLQPAVAIRKI